MAAARENFKLVVGVDFGTTGIAGAYTLLPVKDPPDIYFVVQLAGTAADKAPTRIALKKNPPHELVRFGPQVDQLTRNGVPEDAVVFHRFKMALYASDSQHLNLHTAKIKADIGDIELSALVVISRSLEAISKAISEEIEARGLRPSPQEIQWVLTVPAIWSQEARQFMRTCAQSAGIIKDINSRQLLIGLEPECAAIDVYGKMHEFQPGKYMVVDAGGGTIDVTVHQVDVRGESLDIRELHKASGNNLGGTFVDQQFIKFLHNLFPTMNIQDRGSVTGVLYELLTLDWEEAKTTFGKDRDYGTNEVIISLADFEDDLPDGCTFDDAVASYNARFPTLPCEMAKRRRLKLSCALMKSFFEEALKGITSHLMEIVRNPEVAGLRRILLVGGFAHCYLLQDALKTVVRQSSPDCELVIPNQPHLSVVRGAVLFGANPGVVSMRRARMTYGMKSTLRYDAAIHPQARRVWDDARKEYRVQNIFSVFVREGDRIEVDEVVEQVFYPLSDKDTKVTFVVVASPKRDVQFTDDALANVVELGQIELEVPAGGKATDKRCVAVMKFGTTVIEVECINDVSRKKCNIKYSI